MPDRTRAMLIGRTVFALLAVLTIVEYVVAVSLDTALFLLLAAALAKAWLIVVYFMHVRQLREASE